MFHLLLQLLTVALLTLCTTGSPAVADDEIITGRVVGVSDGDTLTLLTSDHNQLKVRLAEIDAPETGQPYGAKAKQELSGLVFGKTVRVVRIDTDRYGRAVARVYADDLDINAEMIQRGAAWAYRDYLIDTGLLDLEEDARSAGRGLWALQDDQRVPPWDWRRSPKTVPHAAPSAPAAAPDGTCGSKRYCKEMADCAEARHYLLNCGLVRLDGDGDGVPCETLCRSR